MKGKRRCAAQIRSQRVQSWVYVAQSFRRGLIKDRQHAGKRLRIHRGATEYVQVAAAVSEAVCAPSLRAHQKSIMVRRPGKGDIRHVAGIIIWNARARLPAWFAENNARPAPGGK